MRIRVANRMMAFFVVGAIIAVMIGKHQKNQGTNMTDITNDWINQQRRIGNQKREDQTKE